MADLTCISAKFWQRVSVDQPDACWEWQLSTGNHGYGQWIPLSQSPCPVESKNWLAHRMAWFLTRGPIPPAWTIDHICRNRRCCNPAHLRLRTNVDNARDNGFATRTHCPRGHEYAGDNLIRRRSGKRFGRFCRACRKIHNDARTARLKAGVLR